MRNHELNHVRISNPDGLYKKYREPNRISPKNMRSNSIREALSRSVRETIRVAEFQKRRDRHRKQRQKRKSASIAARGASMAGHALLIFTAVVFCAVVYVSSLTIRVRPCSGMATALAFQTYFRNPDETPLRATLYSERDSYEKDFVGVAYLLFDGLEKHTKYALSITNLETEEKIYASTFLTAEEDPYWIQVQDPTMTEDGLFQFSLAIGGLEERQFYTVYVMDENGKVISVTDHSETQATFSIPVKSFAAQPSETEETPSGDTGQPSDANGQPSDATGQPSDTTGQPSSVTEPPSSGTGQPSDATGQPSDTTGQPSSVTELPSSGTGQPSDEPGQQSDEMKPPSDETGQPSEETVSPVDMDSLPFVTVKIDGKVFLPRVWNQEQEPGAEPVPEPDAEPVPEPDAAPEVEWIWNDDHTEAVAVVTDPEHPEETVSLDATFDETVAKEPSCTEAGLAVYELSAADENGTEYTDIQTEVIPPKGHSYERVRLDETESGTSAEYVCEACGKTYRIDAAFTEEPD